MTFQLPRSLDKSEGEFIYIPIYGLVKLSSDIRDISPYCIGQLGYNLFIGDNSYRGSVSIGGGLYYGIGTGIMFKKKYQVELLYSVNSGGVDLGYSSDHEYSKISLFLGCNF